MKANNFIGTTPILKKNIEENKLELCEHVNQNFTKIVFNTKYYKYSRCDIQEKFIALLNISIKEYENLSIKLYALCCQILKNQKIEIQEIQHIIDTIIPYTKSDKTATKLATIVLCRLVDDYTVSDMKLSELFDNAESLLRYSFSARICSEADQDFSFIDNISLHDVLAVNRMPEEKRKEFLNTQQDGEFLILKIARQQDLLKALSVSYQLIDFTKRDKHGRTLLHVLAVYSLTALHFILKKLKKNINISCDISVLFNQTISNNQFDNGMSLIEVMISANKKNNNEILYLICEDCYKDITIPACITDKHVILAIEQAKTNGDISMFLNLLKSYISHVHVAKNDRFAGMMVNHQKYCGIDGSSVYVNGVEHHREDTEELFGVVCSGKLYGVIHKDEKKVISNGHNSFFESESSKFTGTKIINICNTARDVKSEPFTGIARNYKILPGKHIDYEFSKKIASAFYSGHIISNKLMYGILTITLISGIILEVSVKNDTICFNDNDILAFYDHLNDEIKDGSEYEHETEINDEIKDGSEYEHETEINDEIKDGSEYEHHKMSLEKKQYFLNRSAETVLQSTKNNTITLSNITINASPAFLLLYKRKYNNPTMYHLISNITSDIYFTGEMIESTMITGMLFTTESMSVAAEYDKKHTNQYSVKNGKFDIKIKYNWCSESANGILSQDGFTGILTNCTINNGISFTGYMENNIMMDGIIERQGVSNTIKRGSIEYTDRKHAEESEFSKKILSFDFNSGELLSMLSNNTTSAPSDCPVRRYFESELTRLSIESLAENVQLNEFMLSMINCMKQIVNKEHVLAWDGIINEDIDYLKAILDDSFIFTAFMFCHVIKTINTYFADIDIKSKSLALKFYEIHWLMYGIETSNIFNMVAPQLLNIYDQLDEFIHRGRTKMHQSRNSVSMGTMQNHDIVPRDMLHRGFNIDIPDNIKTRSPDRLDMVKVDDISDTRYRIIHGYKNGSFINGASGSTLIEIRGILFLALLSQTTHKINSEYLKNIITESGKIYIAIKDIKNLTSYIWLMISMFLYIEGGHSMEECEFVLWLEPVKDEFEKILNITANDFSLEKLFCNEYILKQAIKNTQHYVKSINALRSSVDSIRQRNQQTV